MITIILDFNKIDVYQIDFHINKTKKSILHYDYTHK